MLLLGMVVVLVAAVTVTASALKGGNAGPASSDSAACHDAPTLALHVSVAPEIAPAVQQVSDSWQKAGAKADGKCVQVVLTRAEPSVAEQQLSTSSAGTSMWIPDASLWARQLSSATAGETGNTTKVTIGHSLANSPLVVVASPAKASSLAAHAPGWAALLGGALNLPNPLTSAVGALTLLTGDTLNSDVVSQANTALVATMAKLSHETLATPAAGFDALAATPDSQALFTASEQSVIAQNKAKGGVFAAAVYPTEGSLALDYPVVELSHPQDDPAVSKAVDAFEQRLRSAPAQRAYHALGFRSADGEPPEGVIPGVGAPLPMPTPDRALDVIRLWRATVEDTNLLLAIDVSGSMLEPAGNGKSKIQVAADAFLTGGSFIPDTSKLGLWVFSSNQTATTPWAQLVAPGLMSARVGDGTRRDAIGRAIASMPSRVHGETALYDTTRAAWETMRADYDPERSNSIVLVTDGQNEYNNSISLATLLATLKSEYDPKKPIQITTMGIGRKADKKALQQISEATHSTSYIVTNANDIRGMFLDVILHRPCSVNCSTGSP